MNKSEVLQHLPMLLTLEQSMAVNNMIFCTKTGSHMYGTSTPLSDTDMVGIFIPTRDYVIGTKRCEQVEFKTNKSSSGKRNTKDDVDITLYSLPKFIHLASQCNPNILEIFFANSYYATKYGKILRDSVNMFLSKRLLKTFGGYANSQLQKLETKKDRHMAINDAHHELNTMVGSYKDSKLFYDPISRPVVVQGKSAVYKTYEKGTDLMRVRKDLEKLAAEYGLRTKSIEEHGYDTKFAMHLVRILLEGLTLMKNHKLVYPLPEAKILLEIRNGEWKQDKVVKLATTLFHCMDITDCNLPLHENITQLNQLQIDLTEQQWSEL